MSGLRSLLRLDEKVASEGRRIQNLDGPSMKWVGPTALVVALGLHLTILLLPAVRLAATAAAASPVPDFPLVWRAAPPVILPTALPKAVPEVPGPALRQPVVARAVRALATEPVPEPAPEFSLNTIPANFEAIIPNPDTPPPSAELGPPSRVVPAIPLNAPPTLVESVRPVYPVAARSLGAEGRVMLRLAVLPDGSVGGAIVLDCSRTGLGFEAAAQEAAKRWRYETAPPQSGERRVVVWIHFQQEEGRP